MFLTEELQYDGNPVSKILKYFSHGQEVSPVNRDVNSV